MTNYLHAPGRHSGGQTWQQTRKRNQMWILWHALIPDHNPLPGQSQEPGEKKQKIITNFCKWNKKIKKMDLARK